MQRVEQNIQIDRPSSKLTNGVCPAANHAGKIISRRRDVVRGLVVNFDLGTVSETYRSQQRGSLRPRARRVAVLGWVRDGVTPSR